MSLQKKRNAHLASWTRWTLLALWLLCAAPVYAQAPPVVELTESQLDLNARAIELIGEGKLDQAVGLFESSLSLGKSNVTYLNLGRTFARLGHCARASQTYDAVESAPQVPEPSPAQVGETLSRYRTELADCGAKLVIQCDPASLQVRIDDGEPAACPVEPIRVDAGKHTIAAVRADGEERVQLVDVGPKDTVQLLLVVPTDPPDDRRIDDPPAPAPKMKKQPRWVSIAGWGLASTGIALFVTATILDMFFITPKVADFKSNPDSRTLEERTNIESQQRIARVLFPVGAVLGLGGGAMILFWPRQSVDAQAAWSVNWRFAF